MSRVSKHIFLPALFFLGIILLAFGAERIARASVHVFGLFLGDERGKVTLGGEDAAASASFTDPLKKENASGAIQGESDEDFVRIIRHATILDHLPERGKFVTVDLLENKIMTYADGRPLAEYPIAGGIASSTRAVLASRTASDLAPRASSARPLGGAPLPVGMSEVGDKKKEVIGKRGMVLPWRVLLGEGCIVHGAPYQRDFQNSIIGENEPEPSCLLLSNKNAKEFFAFAEEHTPLYVYDGTEEIAFDVPRLVVDTSRTPKIGAKAFIIADVITGDVYMERRADSRLPIASVTKLMTADIADDVFSPKRVVPVSSRGSSYTARDLFYPLFLRSDNRVAESFAAAYGTHAFLERMNTKAYLLGMRSTSFEDASGISPGNRSSAADLFKFASYLYEKKKHLLEISHAERAEVKSTKGVRWTMASHNRFAADASFLGGKLGFTDAARQTGLSLFKVEIEGEARIIGVVILGSNDWKSDTRTLLSWFARSARPRANTLAASQL